MTTQRYKPISDYGAIGNLRTVALVARDGSIDWCCMPDMADPSVFASILDAEKGGLFRVSVPGIRRAEQRYLDASNVLETRFETPDGALTVTDFFPLDGDIAGKNDSVAPPEIHRILHCEGSEIDIDVRWEPRFDYGRSSMRIDRVPGGFEARDAQGRRMSLNDPDGNLTVTDDRYGVAVDGRFRMRGGERRAIVTRWGHLEPYSLDASMTWCERTLRTWRRWAAKDTPSGGREWAGPWREHVLRSELALKLLTHADSGAIAAAATTSLPETIGGVRNWDYRYCWIRDAAMTGEAFIAMGHDKEMVDFVTWAERVSESHAESRDGLRIMYGLHGEDEMPVEVLDHFEGYHRSQPVQIGNHAVLQDQPDVFGELIDAAYQLVAAGYELPEDVRAFLPSVADAACESWKRPDNGLWEAPKEPRHYVYSKVMIWVALDRALRLADECIIEGNTDRWRASREAVKRLVFDHGYNEERGAFVSTLGGRELDASSLMFPILGLLDHDDPRVRGTIDRTLHELTVNDAVYRYRWDDGLPGEEGAFVICTSWLVDALALSGRVEEAQRVFENLDKRANHLGLYAEQLDPYTGMHLGNFPQAFSHIGYIANAVHLSAAEGRYAPRLLPPK